MYLPRFALTMLFAVALSAPLITPVAYAQSSLSFSGDLNSPIWTPSTTTPHHHHHHLAVSLAFSPANPVVGTSVTFVAAVSGGVSPFSYAWNFGDGFTVVTSTNTVTHTYTSVGSFLAFVKVTDAAGASATSKTVTVPVS